jgi:hypothetical protein
LVAGIIGAPRITNTCLMHRDPASFPEPLRRWR